MNKHEAIERLAGFRPNSGDEADPYFREALELVQADPELRDWFAREQQFDAAFAEKIAEITPPAGLLEKILESAPAGKAEAATPPDEKKLIAFHPPWWKKSASWGAAACFALLFALGLVLFDQEEADDGNVPPQDIDTMLAAVVNYSGNMDFGTYQRESDDSAIKEYLEANQAPTPTKIPDSLAALPRKGCQVIKLEGVPVSMVCFNSEDKTYHLFTFKKSCDVSKEPDIKSLKEFATACWAEGNLIHILTIRGGSEQEISSLL